MFLPMPPSWLALFLNYILLLCYYSCPDFSPITLLHLAPPLPQAIPPLFLSMSHAYKLFVSSISYTELYSPMAIL